jgi:selenocysteine lyase/cysteine desulfurase
MITDEAKNTIRAVMGQRAQALKQEFEAIAAAMKELEQKEDKPCASAVAKLNAKGIRTHMRKADYFSGNILEPLGQPACIRVSLGHYNTTDEVLRFLRELEVIISAG